MLKKLVCNYCNYNFSNFNVSDSLKECHCKHIYVYNIKCTKTKLLEIIVVLRFKELKAKLCNSYSFKNKEYIYQDLRLYKDESFKDIVSVSDLKIDIFDKNLKTKLRNRINLT